MLARIEGLLPGISRSQRTMNGLCDMLSKVPKDAPIGSAVRKIAAAFLATAGSGEMSDADMGRNMETVMLLLYEHGFQTGLARR